MNFRSDSQSENDRRKLVREQVVLLVLLFCLIGTVLFVSAGTLMWWRAWAFLAEFALCVLVMFVWMLRCDPDLLRERIGSSAVQGQARWDRLVILFFNISICLWLLLMGLDQRWQLTHMPQALAYGGALMIPVTFLVQWRAFRVNTFASSSVKLQDKRRQSVVTTGPYAVVRHPIYAGTLFFWIGVPLLLRSWTGIFAAILIVSTLVFRTLLEERTLRNALDGYGAYTLHVRYRWIPHLW